MSNAKRESILGQPITWTTVQYTHRYDFDMARTTGRSPRVRVEVPGETRTGVVWSAGPVVGTAWVIPTERRSGEGHAVCVQIPSQGRPTQRPADVERSRADNHQTDLGRLQGRYSVNGRYGYDVERGAAPVNVAVSTAQLTLAA